MSNRFSGRFSGISLRTRLALRIALIAAAMTAVGVAFGFWSGTTYLTRSHQASIASHMRLASVALAPSVLSIDYLGLRRQLDLVMEYEGIVGVRVLDQNSHVLMERGTMDKSLLIEPIMAGQAITGWIEISFSNRPVQSGMIYILGVGVLLFIGFVPLFIYLVWRVSGRALLDLTRLTEQVKTDLGQVLPEYPGEHRADEVGVLATALHRRDQALAANIHALEQHQAHLEDLVQKRTAALRRSELLSRTILTSIPDAIALVDKPSSSILDVNDAFAAFYGRHRDELLGLSLRDIARGDGRWSGSPDNHPLVVSWENGKPTPLQSQYSTSAGETLFLEITAWPVNNELNEHPQMVLVQQDITEQCRLANLRQDVERIVLHDLKSPLVGIIGLAELLSHDQEQDPEQLRTFSEHILESGRRMLDMLNNSMDLFNMEQGRYVLRPAAFDLTVMLRLLENETRELCRQRAVELIFTWENGQLDWNRSLEMYAERQKIHSMLLNILNNALEAAPLGSKVTLRIQRMEGTWLMETHNMGVVPEEIRDRFFDRYVTAGKPGGTGLGTYSAMLIARSHGGRITFTTSASQGTHVTVTIPRCETGGSRT
ncbi:ATP-binding protein [Desulfonatronum thioautotrophicum]|uniref:ATP-binding protein n=1 Tax=Desulfonatronum thioautotrophicum TaxID=617001 RepID=UPI00069A86A4|nr:ATP-binding protein [Desulfonatronum thioautotrophicum]